MSKVQRNASDSYIEDLVLQIHKCEWPDTGVECHVRHMRSSAHRR